MCAVEPFSKIFKIEMNKHSKINIQFVEVHLFLNFYAFLNQNLKDVFGNIFENLTMEHKMLETSFIRYLIKDLIQTQEYTLEGIARYTQSTFEIIYDLAIGKNTNPSFELVRKIMDLHRQLNSELYLEIFEKLLYENNRKKNINNDI